MGCFQASSGERANGLSKSRIAKMSTVTIRMLGADGHWIRFLLVVFSSVHVWHDRILII